MLNSRQPIEEIDALLRERVVELVADITGTQPNKLLSRKGEARFGSKGGIAVTTAGKDKGRITLFDGDGKGRSPFQFIQYELNLEFSAAVSWASNWLGLDNAYRPNPVAQELANQKRDTERAATEIAEQQDRQKKIDTAVELAGCSLPAARTDGEASRHSTFQVPTAGTCHIPTFHDTVVSLRRDLERTLLVCRTNRP